MKNLKNNQSGLAPLNSAKQTIQSGFTLIEILVVIGMIALLATIVLIAINPARQFKQGRNTQRTSNTNAILNAIGQYTADKKGDDSALGLGAEEDISSTGANICDILVTDYMPSFPVDPGTDPDGGGALTKGESIPNASCGGTYDTGYRVRKDSDDRITVLAPDTEIPPADKEISVTR